MFRSIVDRVADRFSAVAEKASIDCSYRIVCSRGCLGIVPLGTGTFRLISDFDIKIFLVEN